MLFYTNLILSNLFIINVKNFNATKHFAKIWAKRASIIDDL